MCGIAGTIDSMAERAVARVSLSVARYLRFGAMAADQNPFLEITAIPPNGVSLCEYS